MHQSGWIDYACKEFVQPTIGLIEFKNNGAFVAFYSQ